MTVAKIKMSDELNERRLKMHDIAHGIAQEYCYTVWNDVVKNLFPLEPISGDEALSALSTLLSHFTARFILLLKENIADKDDTGYTLIDIQDVIFQGVREMLKTVPDQNNSEIKKCINGE